jgi:ABC-type transporter Mla maintaining outer membrane lipid asymmetry ATPase subunit MlaF
VSASPVIAFHDVPIGLLRLGSQSRKTADSAVRESHLNLAVQEHETVALVGDEASGVDMLCGLALGMEPLPGGRIEIFGSEVGPLPRRAQLAFRRRVGYLPAGDGLLQNLSLRDNIELPLRFGSDFRARDIEGRVNVIVAALRLMRAEQLRPAQANQEERRRAALGRALAFDPELVLMEQPFDGLTERVGAELLEVARGGETAEGGRRSVLMTGQGLPALLRPRVERVLRLTRGQLEVVK